MTTKHARHFPKKELSAQLTNVLKNEHSDFYKKRFKSVKEDSASSYEKWKEIPLLTRQYILDSSVEKRIHTQPGEVEFIRHTSGTSGTGILISPRITYGDYEGAFSLKSGERVKLVGFMFPSFHDCPRSGAPLDMIMGDATDLGATALLAKQFGANAMWITPSTGIIWSSHLKEAGVHKDIQSVVVSGERCSPLQFKMLRKLYPDASIVVSYASSEAREVLAYSCKHNRYTDEALILKPSEEFFYEIFDPETETIIEDGDARGELILTTLKPKLPVPLIRYRTGDLVQRHKLSCGCSTDGYGYEMLGRITVLPVRVTGGEFTGDYIEEALYAMSGVTHEYYEGIYAEISVGESVRPHLHINVVVEDWNDSEEVFAETLSRCLPVSPTRMYGEGVEKGLYAALTVSFIEMPEGKNQKKPVPVLRRLT